MNIKITGLANISNMALKAQITVERDTNVPRILRWKNQGAVIKYNQWELQSRSKLRSNDQKFEFSFITIELQFI